MTFKNKHIHKFYAFALAAVFALTLAGCGGSGGGTAAMPDPEPPAMPEPTPQEMCEGDGGRYNDDGTCTSAEDLAAEMAEAEALSAAQEAAMATYMAAAAAVAGAKDPVAAANAQPHATAAMEASAAAAAATDSAMAMEHRAAAEAASASAVEAAGTRGLAITTLANSIANKSAIDSATLVGTAAPAPISNAGRVGRALRTAARPTTPVFGNTPPTDASSTTNQGGGAVTATVEYKGAGPAFTVSRVIGTDPAVALRPGETPTAIMSRGGWAGAEVVGASPAGTAAADRYKENALLFTDINPPKQQYYATDAAATAAVTAAGGTVTDATNNFYTDTELAAATVVNTAVISGDVPGDGSHFVGTLNPNPTDNNPPISGRFHCPTAPCSISVNASGVLVAVQGYQFRNAIPGSISAQDSDYLTWGVWVNVPSALQVGQTTGGLSNPAVVSAFANGNNRFEVKAALTGTATYNGVANGLYSAAGMVEYFEADASLSADFGGRSGNDADPTDDNAADTTLFGAVSGSITNIKAGGMDVDGSIALGKAKLVGADHDGDTGTALAATNFNGNTSGTLGGRAISGRWGGRFYGSNKAPEGSVAVRTEFPTTAAGTFGAATPGGVPTVSILGSFGTWKAD